jgi:hypothetical protein
MLGSEAMFTNRIANYSMAPASPAALIPAGFAVCPQAPQNSLTLQLLAQQQAYEQALLRAREEALRIALARLKPSQN